jgi:hypothetical protein
MSNVKYSKIEEACHDLYINVKLKSQLYEDTIDFNEERSKLKEINILTIIQYIKESIDILVGLKVEQAKTQMEKEAKKKQKSQNNSLTGESTSEDYEKVIRKLEADLRNHIKLEYQMKLHNEYLEGKIEESEIMQNEFVMLQKKFEKYEKKIIQEELGETDKKENEILILRAENGNLKNIIAKLEEEINTTHKSSVERLESNLKELHLKYEKEMSENKLQIEKLNKKLIYFEEMSKSTNEDAKSSRSALFKNNSSTNIFFDNQEKNLNKERSCINLNGNLENVFLRFIIYLFIVQNKFKATNK